MKRTILFLEQQCWRGGAQQVLEKVLDSLSEDFRPLVAFPQEGPFRDHLEERGVETLVYPLGSYRPGRKSLMEVIAFALRTFLCAAKLTYIMLTKHVRLVYINGPRCLPAGVLAARLARKPVLFHLHNTLTRRTDIFLASRLARFATKVIACSNAAASVILAACPGLKSKTTVLYNCVSKRPVEESAPPLHPHAPFTIGIVGRLTEGKGHHVLVEAVSMLDPAVKKLCRLVIVGAPAPHCPEDDSYVALLKARSQELSLEDKILWAGHQSDVDPYYRLMDVLAVPSVCKEGLSLVVLEAMQRGIPVIATAGGGTSEIVEHKLNGLLVPSENVEALARALNRIQTDAELFRRLSAGTRPTIDARFSPELFSLAIKSLVLELCPSVLTAQVAPRPAEVSHGNE